MGYAPVLKADVTATVERPTGGPVTIVLKDKGAGIVITDQHSLFGDKARTTPQL